MPVIEHKYNRSGDYDIWHRNNKWKDCHFCAQVTRFKDRICGDCRSDVPDSIPFQQVHRYLIRIKKGKTECQENF